MWFIDVEVEQETSAPPPNKKPGSASEQQSAIEAKIQDKVKTNNGKYTRAHGSARNRTHAYALQ